MSLRRLTINTAAMSSVTVLRMLVQTLIVPVLARFLTPSDYGVVAMAMPFVFFAMMFADAGVGVSLVKTPPEEQVTWSTSFWLTVFLGLGLTVASSIVGALASVFLSEPRLQPVILALSLIITLQSVATVPGIALQQKHRFGVIAAIEICAMLVSLLAAFITAINGGGVWSLVAQQLAHYCTKLPLTFYYSTFRPRLLFKISEIKEHLTIGRDFLGANFISFFTQSCESMILGKMLGAAQLGIYSMAFLFARLPSRIVSGPLQLVIYPHFAKIRHDPAAIAEIFLFLTRVLSIVVIPGMGMIAVAYHPIFTIVLSEKWAASGTIFMIVAPAVILQTVTALRGTVIMAIGLSNIVLRMAIESSLIWGLCLLLSSFLGLTRVAVAYDVAAFAYIPRSLLLTLKPIGISLPSYLRSMQIPVFATVTCILTYLVLVEVTGMGNIAQFCLAAGLAICGIAVSAFAQWKLLMADVALIRQRAL